MFEPSIPPPAQATPPPLPTRSNNAGALWTTLAVAILALNATLSFLISSDGAAGADVSYSIGYITGQTLLLPLLVVGLFQIGKRFRNPRSQTKILFWTSLLVFVSLIGTLASQATQP